MFRIGPATRIYLAVGATDMRKGFNGLHGLVRDRLEIDPTSGHLFLFCNESRIGLNYCSGMGAVCGCVPRRTLHTARNGSISRILYPYHPLFGQDLEVFGAAGGLRDLVYVRMANNTTRGIPAWMFDEVVWANIRGADRPTIDRQALLKLAQLLDQQLESRGIEGHEPSTCQSKSVLPASRIPDGDGIG